MNELSVRSTSTRAQSDDNTQEAHSIFVQNVSHELRTPLSLVRGYAELLRDGMLGPLEPEQQDAIVVIADHANELGKLVERIDLLLAVETERALRVPLTIPNIVDPVVKAHAQRIEDAELTLEVEVPAHLSHIVGDPYHMQQALTCLLENAIKFTPAGGRITVTAWQEGGTVYLSVRDTGIGIPEDKVDHLFDGFFQVDGSSTRRYGGLGLGLTVATSVLKEHGGRLEVFSTVDKGSEFVMKLPVASTPTPQEADASHPAPRRILIVDDEPAVTLTMQAALQKLPHFEVFTADSGTSALSFLRENPCDLVITDYAMPELDGVTLARRAREFCPQTAFIIVTAYNNEQVREQATRVAVLRILDKPVKLQEVRAVVEEALSHLREGQTG
jgi:CheY-like chemotaxis protein